MDSSETLRSEHRDAEKVFATRGCVRAEIRSIRTFSVTDIMSSTKGHKKKEEWSYLLVVPPTGPASLYMSFPARDVVEDSIVFNLSYSVQHCPGCVIMSGGMNFARANVRGSDH